MPVDCSHIFDACGKNYTIIYDFGKFRDKTSKDPDVYSFVGTSDEAPDHEAVCISKNLNIELFNKYTEHLKSRKIVGYGNYTPLYPMFDLNDSRHIMMSTTIFTNIKEKLSHIVEIGGGFGNWLYLNQINSFDKWTIVDLPFVIPLQKWFLKEQDVSLNYEFATPDGKVENPDLVIGAHSLSEISIDEFEKYFKNIMCHAKYVFYAYHTFSLDMSILRLKRAMIESRFDIICDVASQGGTVSNGLYKAKYP